MSVRLKSEGGVDCFVVPNIKKGGLTINPPFLRVQLRS